MCSTLGKPGGCETEWPRNRAFPLPAARPSVRTYFWYTGDLAAGLHHWNGSTGRRASLEIAEHHRSRLQRDEFDASS